MKTITVKVESDADAELLKNILNTTKFQSEVQTIEEDENFTEEEFKLFEERWNHYEKNPGTAISFEDFDKLLKEKYGK